MRVWSPGWGGHPTYPEPTGCAQLMLTASLSPSLLVRPWLPQSLARRSWSFGHPGRPVDSWSCYSKSGLGCCTVRSRGGLAVSGHQSAPRAWRNNVLHAPWFLRGLRDMPRRPLHGRLALPCPLGTLRWGVRADGQSLRPWLRSERQLRRRAEHTGNDSSKQSFIDLPLAASLDTVLTPTVSRAVVLSLRGTRAHS